MKIAIAQNKAVLLLSWWNTTAKSTPGLQAVFLNCKRWQETRDRFKMILVYFHRESTNLWQPNISEGVNLENTSREEKTRPVLPNQCSLQLLQHSLHLHGGLLQEARGQWQDCEGTTWGLGCQTVLILQILSVKSKNKPSSKCQNGKFIMATTEKHKKSKVSKWSKLGLSLRFSKHSRPACNRKDLSDVVIPPTFRLAHHHFDRCKVIRELCLTGTNLLNL